MFCPQCHAEYRPGFTRCADCDVELVDAPHGATQVQPPPEKYGALLWRGDDPHFYLELLAALGREVPSYGRPHYLRNEDSSFSADYGAEPEFEVWVDEPALPRAKWILDSTEEKYERDAPEGRDAVKRGLQNREPGEPIGVCPLCYCEFPTASSFCPNCNVPLHLGLPAEGEDIGARVLSDLVHPQFGIELRRALQSARIPFNNSNYSASDIVTGRSYLPSREILVLQQDFARATRVMAQVLEHWEFEPAAGLSPGRKRINTFWPRRASIKRWQPADLETMLWTGANLSSADAIAMALREHQVPYWLDDSTSGVAKIFVHPEDEPGAREITEQVLEGAAPAPE